MRLVRPALGGPCGPQGRAGWGVERGAQTRFGVVSLVRCAEAIDAPQLFGGWLRRRRFRVSWAEGSPARPRGREA